MSSRVEAGEHYLTAVMFTGWLPPLSDSSPEHPSTSDQSPSPHIIVTSTFARKSPIPSTVSTGVVTQALSPPKLFQAEVSSLFSKNVVLSSSDISQVIMRGGISFCSSSWWFSCSSQPRSHSPLFDSLTMLFSRTPISMTMSRCGQTGVDCASRGRDRGGGTGALLGAALSPASPHSLDHHTLTLGLSCHHTIPYHDALYISLSTHAPRHVHCTLHNTKHTNNRRHLPKICTDCIHQKFTSSIP